MAPVQFLALHINTDSLPSALTHGPISTLPMIQEEKKTARLLPKRNGILQLTFEHECAEILGLHGIPTTQPMCSEEGTILHGSKLPPTPPHQRLHSPYSPHMWQEGLTPLKAGAQLGGCISQWLWLIPALRLMGPHFNFFCLCFTTRRFNCLFLHFTLVF